MIPSSTTLSTGISGSGTSARMRHTSRSLGRTRCSAMLEVTITTIGLPLRARIRSLHELHLGEQMTEVLGVLVALAMPAKRDIGRPFQRSFLQHLLDIRRPGRTQRRRIGREAEC